MPQLIGLAGLAGVGKSTVALHLVKRRGFERYRMAGPLKEMARQLGLTHDQIDGANKEEPIDWLDGVTPRHIMQTLGTEWGRNLIHRDMWIRIAERRVKGMMAGGDTGLFRGDNVVIDDIRFENEVEMVHRLGGKVYRIIGRPPSLFTVAQHISEAQDFKVDGTIENNGSVEDLCRSVAHLLTPDRSEQAATLGDRPLHADEAAG
jgi:hypothetical protein